MLLFQNDNITGKEKKSYLLPKMLLFFILEHFNSFRMNVSLNAPEVQMIYAQKKKKWGKNGVFLG